MVFAAYKVILINKNFSLIEIAYSEMGMDD